MTGIIFTAHETPFQIYKIYSFATNRQAKYREPNQLIALAMEYHSKQRSAVSSE